MDDKERSCAPRFICRESRPAGKFRTVVRALLETDMEKKSGRVKLFQFLFPFALGLLILILTVGSVLLTMGWEPAKNLLNVWVFYAIPLMGKEILIPKTILGSDPPPALLVGATTSLIDVCYCLFLIWNYDWVKSVKYLGPKLERAEQKGKDRIARSKWFSKAAFWATTFFVLVPFKGAGGFGGTILGRIMGLKPYRVLLAVLIGSMIESLTYAFLSDSISPLLETSPFFGWLKTVNVLQIFMVMVMVGLLIYVVRNPREATRKTAGLMYQALDLAEEGVVATLGMSRETADLTMMSAKETLKVLNEVGDELTDLPLRIAASSMKVLGPQGEELAITLEERSRERLGKARIMVGKVLREGFSTTRMGARKTIDTTSGLTIIGLRTAKNGVKKGEYVVLLSEEKVEKVISAPRKLVENGRKAVLKKKGG